MDCKECHERFRADKIIEDYAEEKGITCLRARRRRMDTGGDEEFHRGEPGSVPELWQAQFYRHPPVQPDV